MFLEEKVTSLESRLDSVDEDVKRTGLKFDKLEMRTAAVQGCADADSCSPTSVDSAAKAPEQEHPEPEIVPHKALPKKPPPSLAKAAMSQPVSSSTVCAPPSRPVPAAPMVVSISDEDTFMPQNTSQSPPVAKHPAHKAPPAHIVAKPGYAVPVEAPTVPKAPPKHTDTTMSAPAQLRELKVKAPPPFLNTKTTASPVEMPVPEEDTDALQEGAVSAAAGPPVKAKAPPFTPPAAGLPQQLQASQGDETNLTPPPVSRTDVTSGVLSARSVAQKAPPPHCTAPHTNASPGPPPPPARKAPPPSVLQGAQKAAPPECRPQGPRPKPPPAFLQAAPTHAQIVVPKAPPTGH